jgi:Tetratricopeptide repeat
MAAAVLVILRNVGDRQHEAEILNDMGTALHILGSPEQAVDRHKQALASATHTGDRYDQARAHEGIAQGLHALGDTNTARAHWKTAFNLHLQLGTPGANQIATNLSRNLVN